MDTHQISTAAIDLVGKFGHGAHQVIDLYREGGERAKAGLEARWDAAFEQSKPQLTAETRKNAARARKAFSAFYAKTLAMSASGAEVAVDTFVGATVTAIARATDFAEAALRKTA
ncbi:hypothetical protein [Caenimonas aquaedulcis]|uniref:Phasin domain-containing protein n=1 Tax=Caenimonas aquaedulcis TaxID=2793270 RepID=A0A931MG58_9BURK|nr:hypothetical protein [Caenimonas aquaedulcis]MBG9387783.1 hypothetical protein [Caenimonas aquaedulcis]